MGKPSTKMSLGLGRHLLYFLFLFRVLTVQRRRRRRRRRFICLCLAKGGVTVFSLTARKREIKKTFHVCIRFMKREGRRRVAVISPFISSGRKGGRVNNNKERRGIFSSFLLCIQHEWKSPIISEMRKKNIVRPTKNVNGKNAEGIRIFKLQFLRRI